MGVNVACLVVQELQAGESSSSLLRKGDSHWLCACFPAANAQSRAILESWFRSRASERIL
jgi:hypothetical protein